MKRIAKYTFGMGDRFAHQGEAQLSAIILARDEGIQVYPVWNKSNREHSIIGTDPLDLQHEADAAVQALDWSLDYYVDADHINLATVDRFIEASNFFTIDVADYIGRKAASSDIEEFIERHPELKGPLNIQGIAKPLNLSSEQFMEVVSKFLLAVQEAGKIYRHIVQQKGGDYFVTEISMDETDKPQSPIELLLILAMIADQKIPVQTIAPKFTGRFNKGVDYVGDIKQFETEFEEDLFVLDFAIRQFGLPDSLKLSVHSGSDKFSLYPIINRLVKKHGVGLHVKTAGTTWLEEVIGLAESGDEGLDIAREVYLSALEHFNDLVGPYAAVVDIDPNQLPSKATILQWSGKSFAAALRHDQSNPAYNPHFRQFLHVAFKIAAKMGNRFTDALTIYKTKISTNVSENLLIRHIRPIFG